MRAEGEPNKVLIIQTAFLGDVITATPLVTAVRKMYPGTEIHFLTTPAGSEIISGLPGLDSVIAFDKRGAESGVKGLLKKARELKEMEFDIAICAHRSFRTAALLALAGIKRRIGFATSAFPWLFQERVPRDPERHEVERNLALLGPLGGPPNGFKARLNLADPGAPPDEITASNGKKRVALCPGSVWPTKRWSADGFAIVADGIRRETGAEVYLLGSGQDQEAAAEVEELAEQPLYNLVGRTSLKQWVSAIAGMDLVVTNDSSPTHVACALGVPVVTVFGPTTTSQGFAPWSDRSSVVEEEGLPCRPCGEHGSAYCPEGHFKCMELIDPARVLESALLLMEENTN